MHSLFPAVPGRRPQASCLHLTLSAQLDAAARGRCLARVQDFVGPLGLVAEASPEGITVRSAWRDGSFGPFSRGVVIGWIVAQPEVVMVAVERAAWAAPVRPAPVHRMEVCHD